MTDRPRYVLVIESTPDDVPAPIRLRHVLKRLLRAYGFRCRSVEQVKDVPAAAAARCVLSEPGATAGHSSETSP